MFHNALERSVTGQPHAVSMEQQAPPAPPAKWRNESEMELYGIVRSLYVVIWRFATHTLTPTTPAPAGCDGHNALLTIESLKPSVVTVAIGLADEGRAIAREHAQIFVAEVAVPPILVVRCVAHLSLSLAVMPLSILHRGEDPQSQRETGRNPSESAVREPRKDVLGVPRHEVRDDAFR